MAVYYVKSPRRGDTETRRHPSTHCRLLRAGGDAGNESYFVIARAGGPRQSRLLAVSEHNSIYDDSNRCFFSLDSAPRAWPRGVFGGKRSFVQVYSRIVVNTWGIFRKCRSAVSTESPCCMAEAAIHRSFVGMGVPCSRRWSHTAAYLSEVSPSMG